jgi:hypothetical protein
VKKLLSIAVAGALAMPEAAMAYLAQASEGSARSDTATNGPVRIPPSKRGAMSCAAVKRLKRKTRNRLRSKGQFRKAVR